MKDTCDNITAKRLQILSNLLKIGTAWGWKTRLSEWIGITDDRLGGWIRRDNIPPATILLIEDKGYPRKLWFSTQAVDNFQSSSRAGGSIEEAQEIAYEGEHITVLLKAAENILKSGHPMAVDALERNIRYFAHAIEIENRLSETESAIKEMREEIDDLKAVRDEARTKRKVM